MDGYRIVLADDHALFRASLRRVLSEKPDLEVIGEVGDGVELLDLLKLSKFGPHLVVLDLSLPNFHGIEGVRKIKTIHPAVRLLVMGFHNDEEYPFCLRSAGAEGYLLKREAATELLPAIEKVREGGVYLSNSPSGDSEKWPFETNRKNKTKMKTKEGR